MFGQHKRPSADPKSNVLLERQQRSARNKKATTVVLNIRPSDSPIQQQESSAAVKWMEKIEKRPNASFLKTISLLKEREWRLKQDTSNEWLPSVATFLHLFDVIFIFNFSLATDIFFLCFPMTADSSRHVQKGWRRPPMCLAALAQK
jgi:hypothetical protein